MAARFIIQKGITIHFEGVPRKLYPGELLVNDPSFAAALRTCQAHEVVEVKPPPAKKGGEK